MDGPMENEMNAILLGLSFSHSKDCLEGKLSF